MTDRLQTAELLAAIIESIPLAIIVSDTAGQITLANQNANDLFGYQPGELVDQAIEVLLPDTSKSIHKKLRADFLAKATPRPMGQNLDLYGVRKDGHRVQLEIGLSIIQTDCGPRILSILFDLSTRQQQEETFRASLQAAPIAIVTIDQNGKIIMVNILLEQLFGYDRDELIGQPIEILIPGDARNAHVRLREQFFAHPESRPMGLGRELYGKRKNGTQFPIEIGLNPFTTGSGQYVLAAIADISKRRSIERQLHEHMAKLEQQATELVVSNQALERSNIELERFAYIASHDLQTPLRSISSFAQLLQNDCADNLSPQAQLWAQRAVSGANTLQTLLRNLASFAHINGRIQPFSNVDMDAVFEDTCNLLQASLSETEMHISHDTLPIVVGDHAQLVQLLRHLLGNAIKYTDQSSAKIHVSAQQTVTEWLFTVSDNGIGIHSKYHEKIFDIFQRLHSAETYPGTGAGLAISRRIVHRHGGRIWVESAPGKGSCFHFTLPKNLRRHHEQ